MSALFIVFTALFGLCGIIMFPWGMADYFAAQPYVGTTKTYFSFGECIIDDVVLTGWTFTNNKYDNLKCYDNYEYVFNAAS